MVDEGVTIAVPGSLSPYIRQIDATFFMPYGRYVNALGSALSEDHPEPVYVMTDHHQIGKISLKLHNIGIHQKCLNRFLK